MTGPAVKEPDKGPVTPGSVLIPTPATPTPAAPAISGVPAAELENAKKLIDAQDALIRDNARQRTETDRRLREMEERLTKAEAPPGPTAAERDGEFWKNPTKVIGELIRAEMKTTVDPINARLAATESVSVYDRAKTRLREMPQFKDVWQHIEGSIDQFAQNAKDRGIELDDQVMQLAAVNAYGAYQLGMIPGRPAPVTPTPATIVQTPPHLRPSVAAIPGTERTETPLLRDLTENESRLARERKQSPAEFLAWIGEGAGNVIHSKIGKTEAPK